MRGYDYCVVAYTSTEAMAMLRYNGADPKQNTAKPKPLAALDGNW